MTGATTVPPEVDEYLAAVRSALADLPAGERDDLLAEVEGSLADAAADTATPLALRLGAPEAFAAELRSAAGLHDLAADPRRRSELVRRVRVRVERVAGHPRVRELSPVWWVLRGYAAVAAVALAFDVGWSTRYPVVPYVGSAELGAALVGLAVALSVWLGLRGRERPPSWRRSALAANVVLAVALVPVALDVHQESTYGTPVAVYVPVAASAPAGLVYDGEAVANIYPYSREGRLLHDVLLYDGLGRPLEIPTKGPLDPDRRVVVTNGNRPLFNAFPIRYYEPGTRRVARPNAAPYVELPLVLTPPLPRKAER